MTKIGGEGQDLLGQAGFLNPYLYNKARQTADGTKKTERKKSFSTLLEKVTKSAEDLPQRTGGASIEVETLLDDVHSAGDALARLPTIEGIARYKNAVRSFMRFVLDNGFNMELDVGIPASQKPNFKGVRGSPEAREGQKRWQIKVVDEKLEKLAAGLIDGQLKQIDVLAKLEEINGLLVDMLE